jgi:PPP family 3-phenylpropionic acid transporter
MVIFFMAERYRTATPPSTTGDPMPGRAARFYAAYFGVLGLFMPFAGPYLETRGLGAVGIGCVVAAFSLAKVVYSPWIGRLADRGRWGRGLLLTHGLVAAAAALALPLARGAWSMGVVMVVIGIGYGTILPLVEAAVLSHAPAGYGRFRVWGSVGFVAVSLTAAQLLDRVGMPLFPLLLTASLLVTAATAGAFDRIAAPSAPTTARGIPRSTWLMLIMLTFHQISHGPYYAFFSIRLAEHGYGDLWIGAMWSVGVVAEMVAFRGGDRLGRFLTWQWILGLALALTPLRWAVLCLEPSLWVLIPAQMGHAVTFGLAHIAGVQLVQRSVPVGAVRYAQSLYSGLAFGLGIVVGSAAAGPLYAVAPAVAFGAASAVSLVVAVAWLTLRK